MKRIIIVAIIFLFSFPLCAGEIYIWKDKNGVENITNTPPPENAKIKGKTTYERSSRYEIEQHEASQRRAAEQGYSRYRNQQSAQQRDAWATQQRTERQIKQQNKRTANREIREINDEYHKESARTMIVDLKDIKARDAAEKRQKVCDKYGTDCTRY